MKKFIYILCTFLILSVNAFAAGPWSNPWGGGGISSTYGSIYVADGSTAQSIPTGATYTKLTGFTTNGLSSNATADAANDKITLTEPGVYMATISTSSSAGTSGVEFKCAGFLNGVEQGQIHFERKFPINDVGAAPMSGLIDVTTAPWDFDVRCKHDNGASVDYTLHYSNMTLTYQGET